MNPGPRSFFGGLAVLLLAGTASAAGLVDPVLTQRLASGRPQLWVLNNQRRYGIDVVTNSWGSGDGNDFDPNNPINRASFEAYRRGIVVRFAASNSGPDEDTLNQYATRRG